MKNIYKNKIIIEYYELQIYKMEGNRLDIGSNF